MKKTLELFGCEYIDLGPYMKDEEKIRQLYLRHYQDGKRLGYTPVIMNRDWENWEDLYWLQFEIPERQEKHRQRVKEIVDKVNSRSYEDWYNEIYDKYFLLSDDRVVEEEDRLLCAELSRRPTDEEYDKMTKNRGIVDLRFHCCLGDLNDAIDPHDACYVGPGDVLALIPSDASYEVLAWLPFHGGFNLCPTMEYQVAYARHMHECYGAEVMDVSGVSIGLYLPVPLTDKEKVIAAARDLTVMDNDVYEDMAEVSSKLVYGKQRLYMWWD